MHTINLAEKFSRFTEHWTPHVVAELNGQQVKVAKIKGTFDWHHHEHEDELFLVVRGRFRLEFRDHAVEVSEGELVVVPRGVEHRPVADEDGTMNKKKLKKRHACRRFLLSDTVFHRMSDVEPGKFLEVVRENGR